MSLRWAFLFEFWRVATGDCWNEIPRTFDAPGNVKHDVWLASLMEWRKHHLKNHTGEVYHEGSLVWTRTSFVQPQIHAYDRYLFDGAWTVDRYLDDLKQRYGGIDSVLIWPTYTNIGIDDRNQFDYFRALPGGLSRLAETTREFHQRGVRVLWGYNPWDQATRQEGNHWDTLAGLLKATGGDGFNGDTMLTIPEEFWRSSLRVGHPIAAEPEGGGYSCAGNWTSAGWTPLGWGYFGHKVDKMTCSYDFAPGVDKVKWLDPKGRHLTHVCDRWSKNRTSAIQLAFFNGDGYESWENIWGLFNQLTARDSELLRRAATILRWAGRQNFTHDFEEWVPHAPEATVPEHGIFGSRFESRGDALWLIVNKGGADATLSVAIAEGRSDYKILDLYTGTQVEPSESGGGKSAQLQIETGGVSALLVTKQITLDLNNLLQEMRTMTRRSLASLSSTWHVLHQKMDAMHSSTLFDSAKPPNGMILLPRARFNFSVSGTALEGGCAPEDDPNGICCRSKLCTGDGSPDCQCAIVGDEYFGVDVQFPWESQPQRNHVKILDLGPLLMDQDLVTNQDFLKYLNESSYQPSDGFNFLKHWKNGRPKPGDELKPVVNLGLEEARAFCNFYGKRLPHSYEWQYAAQGSDGRLYPWGHTDVMDSTPGPGHDAVRIGEHPRGNSPFGLRDMVGNVWQYTDSFRDEHTRSVLLRGSSRYQPKVSEKFPSRAQSLNWYFPPARELNKHSKYFLMSNSYERAGTLGFRCAADVHGGAPEPYHYRQFDIEFV